MELIVFDLDHIVRACIQQNMVYHPPLQSGVEERLTHKLGIEDNIRARALEELTGRG